MHMFCSAASIGPSCAGLTETEDGLSNERETEIPLTLKLTIFR